MHRLVHRVLAFTALLALGEFLTLQATHAQTALDRIATEAEAAGAMPEDARSLARAVASRLTEGVRLSPEDSTGLPIPQASDQFGFSVSFDADRAVVGAVGDDGSGADSGSAYVFDLTDGTWNQTAKITATDAGRGDSFGGSVSLDGDRALIGAGGDSDAGSNAGSAYVFDFSGGTWSQTAKLTTTDATAGDLFGVSVALDGNRALIGAVGDDDGGSFSGSAHVFNFSDGIWGKTAKLTATDGATDDQFGISVSLDGNRALIGAIGDDDAGAYPGSAYVFDLSGETWNQTAKLTAADVAGGDRFGRSVSLFGDRALVGAYQDDDDGSTSGSAYVFDFSSDTWSQTAKLTASDAATEDQFGFSVSLSGDRAIISAHLDDVNGLRNTGSAYVFTVPRPVSTEAAPTLRTLGTVAPNPTRSTASVPLTLTEAGEVTISVFDALGRQVASERRTLAAGSHRLGVPVAGLAPGAYVVRVEAPGSASSRRLTVVR